MDERVHLLGTLAQHVLPQAGGLLGGAEQEPVAAGIPGLQRVLGPNQRDAEDAGMEIVGVVHSHTHTEPYPSPTDVAQAPDPAWHYVIVSLRDEAPRVRSYRIVEGGIAEEPLVVEG